MGHGLFSTIHRESCWLVVTERGNFCCVEGSISFLSAAVLGLTGWLAGWRVFALALAFERNDATGGGGPFGIDWLAPRRVSWLVTRCG